MVISFVLLNKYFYDFICKEAFEIFYWVQKLYWNLSKQWTIKGLPRQDYSFIINKSEISINHEVRCNKMGGRDREIKKIVGTNADLSLYYYLFIYLLFVRFCYVHVGIV